MNVELLSEKLEEKPKTTLKTGFVRIVYKSYGILY